MRWRKYRTVRELDKDNNRSLRGIQRLHHRPVADDMAASCATRHVPEGRSDPCGSLPVWPGVRRAGRPRQSPALTPGQRPAQRAALIQERHNSALSVRKARAESGLIQAGLFGSDNGPGSRGSRVAVLYRVPS